MNKNTVSCLLANIKVTMDKIYKEDMNVWERIHADVRNIIKRQGLVYGEVKITKQLILDIIEKHTHE